MTAGPARTSDALRVLVVEDDPMVAELHRGYVESHTRCVVVGTATTAGQALRLAATLRPDVVLLDIHLPDGDGLDVLARVRTLPGPPTDVIATTAVREVDAIRRAMAHGVVHYLVKPFTAAALRERLDATWEAREAMRRFGEGSLDQGDVDRLLARTPTTPPAVPKGLSPRSLELVAEVLRSPAAGGVALSATDVAKAVGMSRVSARRYLEHLVTTGHAKVTPRYGSTGRPENLYRPA